MCGEKKARRARFHLGKTKVCNERHRYRKPRKTQNDLSRHSVAGVNAYLNVKRNEHVVPRKGRTACSAQNRILDRHVHHVTPQPKQRDQHGSDVAAHICVHEGDHLRSQRAMDERGPVFNF